MVDDGPAFHVLARANGLEKFVRRVMRRLLRRQAWPRQEPGDFIDVSSLTGVPAHDLLYFPALPLDSRWQRPQQLASALAGRGTKVTYVEVFDRSIIQPSVRHTWYGNRLLRLRFRVPGRPDPFGAGIDDEQARGIFEKLRNCGSVRADAVLVQHPLWTPVCRFLTPTGAPIIYDRIDLHSGFKNVPPDIDRAERQLISMASAVLFSAPLLRPDRVCARHIVHLPNAAEASRFAISPPPQSPVVGYVGAIDYWFDLDILEDLSRRRPEWQFQIAGMCANRTYRRRLLAMPNVDYVGEIPYVDVPGFFARCSLLLVPFRRGDLVDRVDPVKMYESWAAGLPVVIPEIPGVAKWEKPLLYRYKTRESAEQRIAEALAEDTVELRNERATVAANHTWNIRAQAVEALLTRLQSESTAVDVSDENR